jgi:hypothetical protein
VLKRRLSHLDGRAAQETLIEYMADILTSEMIQRPPVDIHEFHIIDGHDTLYHLHADDYLPWYHRKTHLKVIPPSNETRKEQEQYLVRVIGLYYLT